MHSVDVVPNPHQACSSERHSLWAETWTFVWGLIFIFTFTAAKNHQELHVMARVAGASWLRACVHALAFYLCLLQNHGVGCPQHGSLFNPSSTDALDPVTFFSWAWLPYASQDISSISSFFLPTRCQSCMASCDQWVPSDLACCPVGVRTIWGHSVPTSSCGFFC